MLTLVDGNSLLFRAYYGVHSRLTRRDGTPTGAVYGFFNMVLPILATAKQTDSVICVFYVRFNRLKIYAITGSSIFLFICDAFCVSRYRICAVCIEKDL